ncbi:MAG: hypothetical protein L3J84_07485, partial [Gammaproteobacteria bacterium]|nr:hypothetical protein [Gammaproteobacteria bacterium]
TAQASSFDLPQIPIIYSVIYIFLLTKLNSDGHFLCCANVANHRQAKVAVVLCKMERSGIHKTNDAFDCPSEFALLAQFTHSS